MVCEVRYTTTLSVMLRSVMLQDLAVFASGKYVIFAFIS